MKNKLSLGYNIGTQLVFNLNNQSGFELQYDFISVYNQGYDYYSEGRLYHKDIKLSTHKMTLDYRLKFSKNPVKKSLMIFKSGLFFMHSIKEQTSINWVENNLNSAFSTFNYGVNLGVGREHQIDHFKIEYGLKSDIGIHNITVNQISFPKKFDYATTYYLGGYIALRYLSPDSNLF